MMGVNDYLKRRYVCDVEFADRIRRRSREYYAEGRRLRSLSFDEFREMISKKYGLE